ncbi:hypothetical protein D9M72_598240 [compost metagenome]
MLDVDHHVRVIQQDPASAGTALAADRTEILLAQFLFDAVDDGVDLALTGRGGNQEDVGQGQPLADVQANDVLGYLVRCSARGDAGYGDG